jgi:cytidylate kinase
VGEHEAVHPSSLVIAVDGPSGSGKSTISRAVATRFGLRYLDTGATYRAITWQVLDRGVDTADADAVAAVAEAARLEVGTDPAGPWVRVDDHDVTAAVRGPEVTAAVSAVSAVPQVRERLVAFQREVVGDGGIVVEGRDIATVVLPDAPVKVFLTASDAARAARRAGETAPATGGDDAGHVAATLADLARRDRLDSTRTVAPLAKAPDAVELDSTGLGIEEVTQRVVALCEAVLEREGNRR